jgi:hypothetical protein
MEIIH